jgi:hypothetical protein
MQSQPRSRRPRRTPKTISGRGDNRRRIVRIAISQAAFEAIVKTLPFGSVGYENKVNEKGERLTWLDLLLARQLTRSTVLSAQISTLDTSADLPSAYFPRRST